MSALMVAKITVKKAPKFKEYIEKTFQVAAPYGAELLARDTTEQVLTGETKNHDRLVIVKFPSVENIEAWYGSNEYQQLVPLREAGADIEMTSYQVVE
jgi:uncharacterized protein (DUF1330 family)